MKFLLNLIYYDRYHLANSLKIMLNLELVFEQLVFDFIIFYIFSTFGSIYLLLVPFLFINFQFIFVNLKYVFPNLDNAKRNKELLQRILML